MQYTSTRDKSVRVTASQAILQGLSKEGGLFVPCEFPKLSVSLEQLADMDYRETAYTVMKDFLSDFTEEELKKCIDGAYDDKFDTDEIAPIADADGVYYLELFHGKTIAFKDMALSILPHLLTTAAKKNNSDKEIVILTATSGDTGKAALAGFADVKGTRIIVFYPKGGVSKVQERQMVTQKEKNTEVVGVKGNFDDCQSKVKELFGDEELKARMAERGFQFSSANSINIGRLVPQIVYYVYAYGKLLKEGRIRAGEMINICVPTGNFGNILAAYYAKKMGLPVNMLICASNENRVLFDFFKKGEYDRNREFILTDSPSMDILISSNLERLIYLAVGSDSDKTAKLMNELKTGGKYSISDVFDGIRKEFTGEFASMADCADKIHRLYGELGYVIDTHTAVAGAAYDKYLKETGDNTKTIIASTASPYKFARAVMKAIDAKYADTEDFELIDILSKVSKTDVPKAVSEIRTAPVVHDKVVEISEMKKVVEDNLGL
ncbi:MAG: threonine synthase [Lachnospiraceae bacterium]|nr:threonine synthase [Lachnospiraceae bacterium]